MNWSPVNHYKLYSLPVAIASNYLLNINSFLKNYIDLSTKVARKIYTTETVFSLILLVSVASEYLLKHKCP